MDMSKVLSNIFSELVIKTDKLSYEDFESIKKGDFKIDIKIIKPKRIRKSAPILSNEEVKLMVDEISTLNSREEVYQLLDSKTKRELEYIADSLDIACLKSDKVETIRNKIVESTIGAILSSQAIQGS
ncbi:hypothetical protein [Aliivibrio sp. S10_S31]|uniref:hypothetical protein n=1 Tax=Aliivibrio sp. S10_S31 TaxID=2720224 RepID=UPI001680D223|nr:hypothetical protein [Aliivibrio sp. S10_S31]MBD1567969.1 hypothetical protein [Aliivibrio sp. S10_S31]